MRDFRLWRDTSGQCTVEGKGMVDPGGDAKLLDE
jgi:hypothetical protein